MIPNILFIDTVLFQSIPSKNTCCCWSKGMSYFFKLDNMALFMRTFFDCCLTTVLDAMLCFFHSFVDSRRSCPSTIRPIFLPNGCTVLGLPPNRLFDLAILVGALQTCSPLSIATYKKIKISMNRFT